MSYLTKTPYDPNLITPSVYGLKRSVIGEMVAILHITFDNRGLKLIQAKSRALQKNEIHELMITDEDEAHPRGKVNRVSALGFFEIKQGGLVVIDDEVSLAESFLGTLAGFDMTHMPNHMNVLLKTESIDAPSIRVGDQIVFQAKD